MQKLVQFGAGNIGRSFIGQLFSRAGWEVVFIDVDARIIGALNDRRSYRIEVADTPPGEILVTNVRALNSADANAVVQELCEAQMAGTAVGANVLPYLYPVLAAGLVEREKLGQPPLDIILCENLQGAAAIVEMGIRRHLPPDFPFESVVGLVETSIGKMVPLMPKSLRDLDPLLVRAEAYNTLIVDALAFKSAIPEVPGLAPRANMRAYVDRKLYIHNLGHAAAAYEAHVLHPDVKTIAEAVQIDAVREIACSAMREAARALEVAYPGEFSASDLEEHIQDLLRRFANPALGDTVFRVGRDVRRKLARTDRIIGAMLLDLSFGVEPEAAARVARAAMQFAAVDENGELDPSDRAFRIEDLEQGFEYVLRKVCGLDSANRLDQQAMQLILAAEF